MISPWAVPETAAVKSTPDKGTWPDDGWAERTTDRATVGAVVAGAEVVAGAGVGVGAGKADTVIVVLASAWREDLSAMTLTV